MINTDIVGDIVQNALFTVLLCSAPLLLISLVVGLVVSIFQTVTSIQEQTLTFVPKVIAIFLGIILLGGWIMNNMVEYTENLWGMFSMYIH